MQLVRTACLAGASRISFVIDSDEVECIFDASLDLDGLSGVWDRGFSDKRDPLNALATGLGAAHALNPAALVVETRADGREARLSIRGDDESFELVELRDRDHSTRIYVLEKFRFGHIVEFLTTIDTGFPEAKALRRFCGWATPEIVVNAHHRVSRSPRWPAGACMGRVATTWGVCEVALQPETTENTGVVIHIVQDGVLIDTYVYPGIVGGVGYFEGTRFATDLTHLSRAQDGHFELAVAQTVEPAYVDALIGALGGARPDDRRRLALAAMEAVTRLVRSGQAPPPSAEGLATLRIWPRGDGPANELIAARDAVHGPRSTLMWVDERFDHVQLNERMPTLFVPQIGYPGVTDPVRCASIIAEYLGVPHEHSNGAFEAEIVRRANEATWAARPEWRAPPFEHSIRIRRGSRVAWAYLGLAERGSEFLEGHRGTSVYFENRLLSATRHSSPLVSVALNGSFATDPTFSSIVFDDEVVELVADLAAAVPKLMSDFAATLVEDDFIGRCRVLERWLLALFTGAASRIVCHQAGASARAHPGLEERLAALEVPDHPYGLLHWTTDPLSRGASQVLAVLGPIAKVRMFCGWDGRFYSLEELCEHDAVLYLEARSDWDRFAKQHAEAIASVKDVAVIVIEPTMQEALDLLLRIDFRDARFEIEAMAAERDFLARPAYEFEPGPILAELTEEQDGTTIRGALVSPASNHFVVDFLFAGRLLERVQPPSELGRFHFAIEGPAIQPSRSNWQSVRETVSTMVLEKTCTEELAPRLLRQFYRQHRDDGSIPDSDQRALYFAGLVEELAVNPDALLEHSIPVFRYPGARPDHDNVSFAELRDLVTERGFLQHTVLQAPLYDRVPAPEAPVVALGSPASLTALRRLFQTRFVEVSDFEAPEVAETRLRFLRRPLEMFEVAGAAALGLSRDGENEIIAGLFHDPARGANGSRLDLNVFHRSRLLSKLTIETPFGLFRAVARGDAIVPDPSMSTILRGLETITTMAEQAAREAIANACKAFDGSDPGDAAVVREDLVRFLGMTRNRTFRSPFDLGDALEQARLFLGG